MYASLSVDSTTITEGSRTYVRVTLRAGPGSDAPTATPLASDVRIPISVFRRTAESGDFNVSSSIRIRAGETSGRGSLQTYRDTDDDDERLILLLGSPPVGVSYGSPSRVGVRIIEDTRPTVSLSVASNRVNEGDSITVRATLSAALPDDVSISVYGGAYPLVWWNRFPAEPEDFDPATKTITIKGGQTVGEVKIATYRDDEGDNDVMYVQMSPSLPSTVIAGSTDTVSVVIVDTSEATAVRLALNPVWVWEDAGATKVAVTVSLNGVGLSQATDVTVAQTGGDAVSGTDYAAITPLTITIPAGSTSAVDTLSFTPTDDSVAEGSGETVVLTATVSGLTSGSATLTIADNDGPRPEVSLLASDRVYEGGSLTVRAILSEALAGDVSIPILIEVHNDDDDGDDERGDIGPDTTIVIPAGRTFGEVEIATNQDADFDDEWFTVSLGTLPGTVSRPGRTTDALETFLYIDDDDDPNPPPTLDLSVRATSADSTRWGPCSPADPRRCNLWITEGDTVTLRATLSAPLPNAARIPIARYTLPGDGNTLYQLEELVIPLAGPSARAS